MKAVCILSGGMDSTTLLHKLKAEGHDVYALSVNYGQRHAKELACAAEQCEILGVTHKVVDLSSVIGDLLKGSSLTSKDVEVPEGHYAAETMKKTVVPNRNMILLSLGAGYLLSLLDESDREGILAYGAHAGDHDIYPDCRGEFISALGFTLTLCDWKQVALYTPFLSYSKANIVSDGLALGVDFSKTWTCYKGGETACGRCGTCVERIEAFSKAGAIDPLLYEDPDFWQTVTKRNA